MKMRVLWVGKTKDAWLKSGSEEYARRIQRYIPFRIDEIKDDVQADQACGRERESERLHKMLSPQAHVVVLDERGDEYTSQQFAHFIGSLRDQGTSELVFVIGGAYGFSPHFYGRAQSRIALSRMTFTHQMVRPVLLEQIYRAFTILNNEPYHH